MFGKRISWLRTSLLALAGVLLASGAAWAHGGGGGHGGGGHGGGMHAGGFGHGYGGFGHGYAGPGHIYGAGFNRGLGYGGLYGRGYGGLGLGYGFALGYGLGYGLNYGAFGRGYGLGYGAYGVNGLGLGYSGYGLAYGMGYPYYGYGYGSGGYLYPYGGNYVQVPYYGGGSTLYDMPVANNYTNYYSPSTQTQKPPKDDKAHLLVVVPENAELWFNGTKTKQTGKEREFVSPVLKPDKRYSYEVKASWQENGKTVEQVRKIPVQANDWKPVDFTKPEVAADSKNKTKTDISAETTAK
jgi:uncharacterized protein (TIGR03000 family)